MKQKRMSYINGLLVDADNASIGIEDLALTRGFGVFDFFRVRDGILIHPEAHIHRLFHSAKQMHLPLHISEQELVALAHQLVQLNCESECGVKLLLTGGYSANGYLPGNPNLIISTYDLPHQDPKQYETGISLITHEYRKEFPAVKTTNYAMGIWLLPEIFQAKADDVLYCWQDEVHECPRSNVFIVNGQNEVLTPIHGILHGITRRNVLHLSRELFPTHETDITREMLYNASEIFITSTTKRIMPVTKLDGALVGDGRPGPVTQKLIEVFEEDEIKYLQEKQTVRPSHSTTYP
ncbi:MAG TPA: aminotransferase class IV [Phnomibacter sp.]|nr:aminotransferase class IV [Phnomibacter sp.]